MIKFQDDGNYYWNILPSLRLQQYQGTSCTFITNCVALKTLCFTPQLRGARVRFVHVQYIGKRAFTEERRSAAWTNRLIHKRHVFTSQKCMSLRMKDMLSRRSKWLVLLCVVGGTEQQCHSFMNYTRGSVSGFLK